MELHKYCSLFPPVSQTDLDTLAADIKENGLLEPIVTFEGKILDGQNRFNACQHAGVEPRFEEYSGENALSYVIAKNFARRHMDESQRAMVAARIATIMPVSNKQKKDVETAERMNVSERSVRSARKVIESGDAELANAVDSGDVAVSVAAKIAKLPENDRRQVLRAPRPDVAVKKVARDHKERELAAKQAELPGDVFGVIYADPPWRFAVRSENGMDRSADNHYPTQSTDDICALDVPSISAEDSVCFLWATVPMINDALSVMDSWGFEYKTHFCWIKDRPGTGYWNRNQHELLLVGTRGNVPSPAPGTQWPSIIDAPVGEHSAKPDIFYELIETYYPTLARLEMNARGVAREGWAVWGLEAE